MNSIKALAQTSSHAKIGHISLSLLVIVGVLLELYVSANRSESYFSTGFARTINLFVYFTIWSNIMVGISSFSIGSNDSKKSDLFWGLRLAGLGSIVVTLVIHRIYLAVPLTGIALVSDTIIHLIVPIAAIVLWLFFGPRGKINKRIILLSTILPNVWIAFTLLRGAVTDWYPYTFLDLRAETSLAIILNIAAIYAFMYVIISILWWLDTTLSSNKSH